MIGTEQGNVRDDGPFIFIGENLALDLVNTEAMRRGKRHDLLMIPRDAENWWQAANQHHPELDKVYGENGDAVVFDELLLGALKTLRTALRATFSALVAEEVPDREDVGTLNAVLKTCYPALDLTERGELLAIYRTVDTDKGSVLVPIAHSALQLIDKGERKRLHRCDNGNCILFFYDTTKSATRRWCSLGCMDRARSAQRYKEAKQQKDL